MTKAREVPTYAYRFGRHDRITIDRTTYRHVEVAGHHHRLQLVNDGVAEDVYIVRSNAEFSALFSSKRCRVDEGYFSKAHAVLRLRQDTSNLLDFDEATLRTIAWRREWLRRLELSLGDLTGAKRMTLTSRDLNRFICAEAAAIDEWYLEKFGERRPAGRVQRDGKLKACDVPSASTLRSWRTRFHRGGCRIEALAPKYQNCGRKPYLNDNIRRIVADESQAYASSTRPTKTDIVTRVAMVLDEENARAGTNYTVSATTVRKVIAGLDKFSVEAGRFGEAYAHRKFAAVGIGIQVSRPMERIEIDDWDVDLMTLIERSSIWQRMSPEARRAAPRIRATITVAIDVATRCVVGLNVSPDRATTSGARACLRRVLMDKSAIAQWAGCQALWPMNGRPETLGTDGGPAFQGDFENAFNRVRSSRTAPSKDPRYRGTIESFFRTFKRLCSMFAGQTFANVVEKGDYLSEHNASLTFEQFYKAVIRYVVDIYHHRPHRGLDGATPAATWSRLTSRFDVDPPLADDEILLAFGFRTRRTISKAGIEFGGLFYNSHDLNMLFRRAGNVETQIVVDPEDLGHILVQIPKAWRGAERLAAGDYLIVQSVKDIADCLSVAELEAGRAALRELSAEEEKAGRGFRFAATRDLMVLGENARKIAGLEPFVMSQQQFDRLDTKMKRSARAGLDKVAHSNQPVTIDNGTGELIATGAGRRASQQVSAQFGGSLNTFGEDDE